tara:strand:- start:492 stop:821 length:330 start_codon:yes stop_codon:yes gene_type:complete
MNIKVTKFVTGEDVVFDMLEETETHVTMKNAALLMMQDRGVGMIPWMPLAQFEDDTVVMEKSKMLAIGNPIPELEKEYTKAHNKNPLLVPDKTIVGGPMGSDGGLKIST